ncbi:MAG: glycosyltransferase family 4 protein, partial [Bacteroidota bacterium]|nr:glycosyltransferase family 4 protein [Bacteroidota bacterium]
YRLHQGLLRIGVVSRLFVQGRSSDDPYVQGPATLLAKAASKVRPSVDLRPLKNYPNWERKMFSAAWLPAPDLVRKINSSDADVVHLHWINGGMLRIEDLAKIRKPMVWSMHDMWAYTGGCHYDENCGKFMTHCGKCPILASDEEKDLSYRVFERKQRTYGNMAPITFIGLSKWMADSARSSALTKGHEVVELPNPIDTQVFKPIDKKMARQILGLPLDRPIVLFGAVNATADPRKGFSHLKAALAVLPKGSVELAIFGASRPIDAPDLGHPTHFMGRLNDDLSLCLLYNAADVTVVPSVQENLSNTIVESLSCGTPAVAFKIGGNPDMIEHMSNGYLAKPFDPKDLAHGIGEVLGRNQTGAFSTRARELTMERFEMELVSRKYLELYQRVQSTHSVLERS